MLSIHCILDFYIQITYIFGIGCTVDLAFYDFTGTHSEGLSEIEHGLLPVRVFGVGGGGEYDRFVDLREETERGGDESQHDRGWHMMQCEGWKDDWTNE